MLTQARILELFAELDEELGRQGIRGDLFLIGGAAMAVAYDARPSTRDVDAVFHPSSEVRSAAQVVAASHEDLSEDWLNDGAKGFLPGEDSGIQPVVYVGEHLSVLAASPQYLLATKLLASRVSRDEDDIQFLYKILGYSTVAEGIELVERFYPGLAIEPKVRFLLEEILGNQN